MKFSWKSRKPAFGLAAVTAAGVAAAVALVGAGPSQAAPVSLTLNYNCPFPLIGDQVLSVKIDTNLPDNAVAGASSTPITFDVDVTVPETATEGLALVGATSLDGSAKAAAVLKYPVDKTLNLNLPLTIASTPVPPSGAFHVKSSGKAPAVTFPSPGTASVTVGNFSTTMTPRTADGQPTDLGTFTSDCIAVPGQNQQLGTFEIKPAGGTTTPTTPTTSTTPTTPTTEPTTPTTEPTTPTTEPTTPTTEPTTPTTEPTTPTTEPTTPTTEPTTPTTAPTTPTTEPTTPTTEPTTPTTEPTTPTTAPTTPTTEPTTPTTQPTTPTTQPTNPPGGIEVKYSVQGKSVLKQLHATLPLGPGTLDAKLDAASGKFGARLALPKSDVHFHVFGFIPASATVKLDQAGAINGTLTAGAVKANAQVDVQLTKVRVFGFLILSSKSCHTVKPADVPLTSEPGFDPLKGGKLTATYDIPRFTGCGFLTGLITGITSGPGNTLDITLAKK
ncbi:DUF6801 domain-containing protein [Amycolatopsis sp. NPDC058278]|uniref:DUF6801 domain-containing protein n=1 Tax=Amycolatopsis sp. NPDC058278 TaxID=3346417 RepID=UPI0036DE1677